MKVSEWLHNLWNGTHLKAHKGGFFIGLISFSFALACLNISLFMFRWPTPAKIAGWGFLALALIEFVLSLKSIGISLLQLGIRKFLIRLLVIYTIIVLTMGILIPTQEKRLDHWRITNDRIFTWVFSNISDFGRMFVRLPSEIRFAIDGRQKATQIPGITWDGDIIPTPIEVRKEGANYSEAPSEIDNSLLHIGDNVTVARTGGASLRVRSVPSINSEIVAGFPAGTLLQIIDGPQTSDRYIWWKVRDIKNKEGWCVEDYLIRTNP